MSERSRLVFRPPEPEERHSSDIDRMLNVCEERGYTISRGDARRAWEDYSEVACAGWLFLPEEDDELFAILRNRCTEE
jgi:hypothetical protein